jgi:hypothetical protein
MTNQKRMRSNISRRVNYFPDNTPAVPVNIGNPELARADCVRWYQMIYPPSPLSDLVRRVDEGEP